MAHLNLIRAGLGDAVCIELRGAARDELCDCLLNEIGPRMSALRSAGKIRFWEYILASNPHASRLTLLGYIGTRIDAQYLLEEIRKSRLPVGAEIGFGESPLMEREYAQRRFGADRGIAIFGLFRRILTPFALEIMCMLRDSPDSNEERYRILLASWFFVAQSFQLTEPASATARRWWLSKLSGVLIEKQKISEPWREVMSVKAKSELAKTRSLAEMILSLQRNGWESLEAGSLRNIFEKNRRDFQRVGNALKSNLSGFHPETSWEQTVYHSYLHSLFLAIGYAGIKELFIYTLIDECSKPRPHDAFSLF